MIRFYRYEKPPVKFSTYQALKDKEEFVRKYFSERTPLVTILAYCLMDTHLHLLLAPLKDGGISIFMKNLLDSYTRYFNIKNKRKGPLWQGRFKGVLVNEVHEWPYSSYLEYLGKCDAPLCHFSDYLNVDPDKYRVFIEKR